MEALINQKSSAKLLRIDINRWGSAVASQYNIRSLPAVWLYNGTELVTSNMRDALNRVAQLD